ncbi:FAD-binding oxidoreductase [Bauldia sp.]|uniref:FAD-binding oxidoreductase n=1 Tax=Bauldia sp. TaxID=2575872 RepID=UPI003BAA1E39
MKSPPLESALIDRFAAIVGTGHALRDADAVGGFLIEPRDKFHGLTPLVLRPGSVDEVSAILRLANETRTAIVPQGGNTGVVGGQVPDRSGGQVILSLSRLNAIRSIEPAENTMVAEAGVILADAHAAADDVDRLFPVSLASEGSCQIGGILSTNAGGTGVLAYGNTRALVLGVEVVLATGEVWDGLRRLRKDNTGYDLRDVFIGAEGTLGVITAAVLRLVPKPLGQSVAIVGLKSPVAALAFFAIADRIAGGSLTAFELMPRIGIEVVTKHLPGARDPLASPHDWYVLFEISSLRAEADAAATVEAIFAEGLEAGLVDDGVQAQSLEQFRAFWRLRHALSEVQKEEGGSIKHDVAVPRAKVPAFIEQANAAVTGLMPGCRPFPFGHLGDGNIHYNISQPTEMDKADYLARWDDVSALVYAIVGRLGGTISAEHGIGQLKRALLKSVKSPIEIDLMRRLKAAFDPNGILNPGKVL